MSTRSNASWCGAACVAWAILCIGCSGGDRATAAGGCSDDVHVADCFAIYGLSQHQDAQHPIALASGDAMWFREDSAALDITGLNAQETRVETGPAGDAVLYLVVREDNSQGLAEWCRTRIGGRVGIVIDGRLRSVVVLRSMLRSALGVSDLGDQGDVRGLVEFIKQCGGARRSKS